MRLAHLAITALIVSVVGGAAYAQTGSVWAEPQAAAVSAAEFGRGSGGVIDVRAKQGNRFSGSLGAAMSTSASPFASGSGRGLDATLGGTLVQDRLWFFGSAQLREQPSFSSRFAALPQQPADTRALGAKLTANLGDRQVLTSSFATGLSATAPLWSFEPRAESAFHLNYTGIVSSNLFFTATASRRTYSLSPLWSLTPAAP